MVIGVPHHCGDVRLYEPHSAAGGAGTLADLAAGEPAAAPHADHHGDQLVLHAGTIDSRTRSVLRTEYLLLVLFHLFLAHQHKACRQLKTKQGMTAHTPV